MQSGAAFSDFQDYRYSLWRRWSEGPIANLLMLNPSKAGKIDNDPTVARQITRASMLGMGGLSVSNLNAYVATDPKDMKRAVDPVGPENDKYILEAAFEAVKSGGIVICAWGKDGGFGGRSKFVTEMLRAHEIPLHALKVTTGEPWHPLYLPYSLEPFLWNGGSK